MYTKYINPTVSKTYTGIPFRLDAIYRIKPDMRANRPLIYPYRPNTHGVNSKPTETGNVL